MRFLIVPWLAFVTALSLGPEFMKYKILQTQGRMHNPGHLVVFMITALLLCWNAGSASSRILRALAAILVGVTLEWFEAVIYHNPYEWKDLMVDCVGIAAGFIIVSLISLAAVPNEPTSET